MKDTTQCSAQGMPWTFQEYDYLYKNYNKIGAIECAKHLHRTLTQVMNKAERLELTPQGEFKQHELDFASTYGKCLGGAMIFLLPKRTSYEVKELIECKNKRSR